jgi:hypothetical protein
MTANVMIQRSQFTITAKKASGRIELTDPITVKNQIQEIRSIDDVRGVNTALRVDGATFIYNANTGQYDVKLLDKLYNISLLGTVTANGSPGPVPGDPDQVLVSNGSGVYWSSYLPSVSAAYADVAGIAYSAYNADSLGGKGWEEPGRIGYRVPNTGDFTDVTVRNLYVNGVSVFTSLLIDGGGF